MIKRAEDQEGKHIGEDKLGALKGKGSLERQKAAGKQSRGSESLFSLSQSPVSHYLTGEKRRSRIDERNMGNESHKEDRNAYPIRHCTRTFFCCECRLSAAHYLTKGRKRTRRYSIHICKRWTKKPGLDQRSEDVREKMKMKIQKQFVCMKGELLSCVPLYLVGIWGRCQSGHWDRTLCYWSSSGSILCIFRYIENSMESAVLHQCRISFRAPHDRRRLRRFVCVKQ